MIKEEVKQIINPKSMKIKTIKIQKNIKKKKNQNKQNEHKDLITQFRDEMGTKR